ncbi:MAG: RecQ family ATP-dependent DNA helicase [Verrucomicrobia bacterium]|nr:RecQ family ATP-dependent DNA helicase [Verrucomicrobiota bacterium]
MKTDPESLSAALQRHFGHSSFRPGQEAVVRALLDGRSALALFPTGAGKSICYQLPAVLSLGTALVVSPLIALMKDQVDALRRRGVAAARLDSSLTAAEASQVLADFKAGSLKLLYVAPERLSSESFIGRIRRARISLFAVDEAHCISEWGHNFRPEYLRLSRVAQELGLSPVLALTATATPEVARDICRSFGIGAAQQVQTPFHRPNLHLRVSPVASAERLSLLTSRLRNERVRPAVVYVTLQKTAEEVAAHLIAAGFAARAYHAGLDETERTAAQEGFMRGSPEIIVATIAFGMGIDKADIRAVFHYNLPKTLENYQQEIGRAGRDGALALCELFACGADLIPLDNFTLGDTPTLGSVRALTARLLGAGEEFDVSRYDLSQETDIRPLVVDTVITYLELEGHLRPVRAFYQSVQIELLRKEAEILRGHTPERVALLRAILGAAERGRKYLTLRPEEAAERLQQPRERIVKALDWLEETGALRQKPAGLRHAFVRTGGPAAPSVDEVAERLHALFLRREQREAERLGQVVGLALESGCLTRRLLAHFGESLDAACGHCRNCTHGASPPAELPESGGRPWSKSADRALREAMAPRHAALREPRQLARYLCGLTSPATTRARLTRGGQFGALAEVPFRVVLGEAERALGA